MLFSFLCFKAGKGFVQTYPSSPPSVASPCTLSSTMTSSFIKNYTWRVDRWYCEFSNSCLVGLCIADIHQYSVYRAIASKLRGGSLSSKSRPWSWFMRVMTAACLNFIAKHEWTTITYMYYQFLYKAFPTLKSLYFSVTSLLQKRSFKLQLSCMESSKNTHSFFHIYDHIIVYVCVSWPKLTASPHPSTLSWNC